MKQCGRCGEWAPDRARFCPECGTRLALSTPAQERRKVVTVVFADVVGSTALGERVDPETLRWAMQRWFDRMRQAVERHGGTIEDYRGDGVMAVFGIPVAHEDDALRAARAALDMREAGKALRTELQAARGVALLVRIGLNTGQAATGSRADGGTFTTGDAVNVAARLEQAAPVGEILLGADTYRLIAHAVEAELIEPLMVKGKQAAIEGYRLLGVAPTAPARPPRAGAPMVDREDEGSRVLAAFGRASGERACELCTVVGSPGVGKSRLVAELAGTLSERATVASGRCLPYGETLTWWPLVEALGTSGLLAELDAGDHPAIPRAVELLKPAGDPVAPDEAQWALRVVLERLARRRPLVLAVDDLQWADPPLLDLFDHLTETVRDAPLLLLGTARPELFDDRPGWRAGAVPLQPLPDVHAADLLRRLAGSAPIGANARNRILEVAEGNPLFVVELVAMAEDGGQALTDMAVPPTIQALLAARLDRLPPAERAVLEAAAIEGKEFTRDYVHALVAGREIDATLAELVRKGLIEPAGDKAFRFHHQLIRDATYEGTSKHARAGLHARFAAALEARLPPATGDELLGYHRERAVLLRRELGETDTATARLAAISLGAAARRAAQREDSTGAVALLERALALVPDDRALRGTLLPALGGALFEAGRMTDATRALDTAMAEAPDLRWRARAGVEREFVRLEADAVAGTARSLHVADAAMRVLEHERDDYGQCRAWSLRAQGHWFAGSVGRADAAWTEAAEFAQRAGDARELVAILGWRATAAVLGPMPVDEAIALCESFRERVDASPVADALMVNPLASLHAMRGELTEAERYLDEANAILHELTGVGYAVSHHDALVRLLSDQPAQAERTLRRGMDRLATMDDRAREATTAAMLAQALYAQDRLAEAAEECAVAEAAAADDDVVTQVIWRGVRAKLLARAGRPDEAEAFARAAVALVEPTDLLTHRADALLDLASVLSLRHAARTYQDVVASALKLYERKGNAVGAARSRSLLGAA